MPEWHSGDVIANGIRIHYTRTRPPRSSASDHGASLPALVLCHGATDWGPCWTLLAKELEGDYDVIMPDARGHGLSEAPRGADYGSDAQAADLAGLIRGLGLGKALVGGHSMGARGALYLAAYYPELVRAIFLEDPPFGLVPDVSPAGLEASERRRRNMLEERTLGREQAIARCRQANPKWSDEELALWADCRHRVSPDFATAPRQDTRLPWRKAMAGLKCPVLLLAPEHGLTTPEQVDEMRHLLPSLRVATIAGTGHCIRRDSPAEYSRLVRQFLAEVIE